MKQFDADILSEVPSADGELLDYRKAFRIAEMLMYHPNPDNIAKRLSGLLNPENVATLSLLVFAFSLVAQDQGLSRNETEIILEKIATITKLLQTDEQVKVYFTSSSLVSDEEVASLVGDYLRMAEDPFRAVSYLRSNPRLLIPAVDFHLAHMALLAFMSNDDDAVKFFMQARIQLAELRRQRGR